MVRKLVLAGMLIMFLSATTCVFAEDVFMTQRGKKYHKEICRLVKNKDNISKLEKEEAVEEGYGPCKRCFKEDVIVDEHQDEQTQKTEKDKKDKLG